MSNHPLSNGADRAGVVAELRRVTALFQLRAVCTAMEIPFAAPCSEGARPAPPLSGARATLIDQPPHEELHA